jgi:hypothetical protein
VKHIDAIEHEAVVHPDDIAINRFADAMKAKMAKQRAKGYGGWNDKNDCPTNRLQQMLVNHISKGDPVDVANFAMMLWSRGERTEQPAQQQEPVAIDRLYIEALIEGLYQNEDPVSIDAAEEFERLLKTPASPPASKPWVGIDAGDWNKIAYTSEFRSGADWAEAKLREKNAAPCKPLTDEVFISMMDSDGICIDPELAFTIKVMVECAHGIYPENSDCHDADWTDRDGEYLK